MKRVWLILSLIFMIVACDSPSTPQKTVEAYLEAVKNNQFEQAYSMVAQGDHSVLSYDDFMLQTVYNNEIRAKILTKISFQITRTRINGDHAVVIVAVNRPDCDILLNEIISQSLKQAFSGRGEDVPEDLKEEFLRRLNSPEMSYSTVDWHYRLIKLNGAWKINLSDKKIH